MRRAAVFWLVPGGILCTALGALTLLVAWSELNLAIASTHMENWWYAPSSERLEQATEALSRADGYSTSRSDLELLRGQVLLVQALDSRNADQFADAAAHFEKAVDARPLWPENQAWLAVALFRSGDRDRGRAALRRSLELGPREGRLLEIFATHAAAVSPLADSAIRSAIFDLADHTAHREPRWTARVMQRLGWIRAWCARPTSGERAQSECRRLLAG